jgi:hypothetical protein
MLGYKGFRSDLTGYGGFQYEIGHTYRMNPDEIKLCVSGFHFCQFPLDVFKYYYNDDDQYALIKAEGEIFSSDDKSVTNQITILKVLTREDLRKMMPEVVIRKNGSKEWYRNGRLHRSDGPAIERHNGDKKWYKNGQLHRSDGPAIERHNGDKEWYKNGQLHRSNGPAIERHNGDKEWYKKGRKHRRNGPAIEKNNGQKEWYINDNLIYDHNSYINFLRELDSGKLHLGPLKISFPENGIQIIDCNKSTNQQMDMFFD